MKNLQAPEKRIDSQTIEVHSIFYTIQGEGPFCGTPAVFIRLAGCNLQCPGCDTDYTSKRATMQVDLILEQILKRTGRLSYGGKLIVITGGEPFRQNLDKLIRELVGVGYYVQIETNGTFSPPEYYAFHKRIDLRTGAYIVCSPKTGKVHPRIEREACAYKYVMNANSVGEDGLPKLALNHTASPCVARPPPGMPVYLQPRDEQRVGYNELNLQACIDSCMKFGYILQLQTHKIIGVE